MCKSRVGMKTLADTHYTHIMELRSQDILRLVKFCLVGLSGVFVSVGTLWFLTDVAGLFYVISAVLSHVLSVTNNFTWNQLWTFRDRSRDVRLSALVIRWVKFLLTTGIAAGLFLGILTLLTEVFGLYYIISALCAIAIATPVNFLASNFWVWRHSEKKGQNDLAKER